MLRSLIREFLMRLDEGAFQDAAKSLLGKVVEADRRSFDDLVSRLSSDPSLSKVDFLRWGWKQVQFASSAEKRTIVDEVVTVLSSFAANKVRLPPAKRDVNSYGTLGQMRGELESLGKTRKEVDAEAREGGDLVNSDESGWKVYLVKSKEASCRLGRGTRWCIAATQSKNYFDQYSSDGAIFVFLIGPQDQKFAFTFMANLTGWTRDPDGAREFDPDDPDGPFNSYTEFPKSLDKVKGYLQVFDSEDEVIYSSDSIDQSAISQALSHIPGVPSGLEGAIYSARQKGLASSYESESRFKDAFEKGEITDEDFSDPKVLNRVTNILENLKAFDIVTIVVSDSESFPTWEIFKRAARFCIKTKNYQNLAEIVCRRSDLYSDDWKVEGGEKFNGRDLISSEYALLLIREDLIPLKNISNSKDWFAESLFNIVTPQNASPDLIKILLSKWGDLKQVRTRVFNMKNVSQKQVDSIFWADSRGKSPTQMLKNLDKTSENTAADVIRSVREDVERPDRHLRSYDDSYDIYENILDFVTDRKLPLRQKTVEDTLEILKLTSKKSPFAHDRLRISVVNSHCPTWVSFWAGSDNKSFRIAAARSLGLTVKSALDLAEDPDNEVREILISNDKMIAPEVLDKLWKVGTPAERQMLRKKVKMGHGGNWRLPS